MKMLNDKKGVIDQLQPMIIALVSIAIVLVVGFLIMSNVASNAQVTADTNATQAVKDVQGAMDDIPDWLPIKFLSI